MSLKARLTAVENVFNRDRDFTLIRVYGGPVDFIGTDPFDELKSVFQFMALTRNLRRSGCACN
jgi:hypothetical protein